MSVGRLNPEGAATISTIDYQRNGVCGEGFHTLQMDALIEGVPRRFIATVFEGEFSEDAEGNEVWGDNGRCAVQEVDGHGKPLPTGWRGDQFESALREAIALTEDERYPSPAASIEERRQVNVVLHYRNGRWVVTDHIPTAPIAA